MAESKHNESFRELMDVVQHPGEPYRRIFTDDVFFELIIWFNNENNPTGFQLCYDIGRRPCALTLFPNSQHTCNNKIHTGESDFYTIKASPILAEQTPFPKELCLQKFRTLSADLPDEISSFVLLWMEKY